MQLGARWRVGETPHRGVPPELHAAIAEAEAAHPGAASWTLTWLEGRPRCALDDVLIVGLDAAGGVTVRRAGSASAAAPDASGTDRVGLADDDDDDDDDDWLS
ncbi:Fe-S oxidoreductase [Leucobacter luti]|uniref:Fe-S oxidoreductase n=1 Tax=Leucobacter luti TaxID=340320 RepID=A0A4Q7TK02_9MICO|nr:Fe-S oxidoreductase [Leucobacter luti]RZT60954.1 hypothetical protein EV139_2700 [Leucobacter luti]